MPISLTEANIYDPYDVYLFIIGNDRSRYARLTDKINSLSENLQDFIFNTVPGDFIKDRISIPLNLNQNQSIEIAKIVLDIILTDVYLGDIVSQNQQRVYIDEQKAKTTAGLIVAELFTPILEELKKKHVEKFGKMMTQPQKQSPLPQIQTQTQSQNGDETIDLRKEFKI